MTTKPNTQHNHLSETTTHDNNPMHYILEKSFAFLLSRTMHIASYYKLFDLLQDTPKSASEMVSGTKYRAHAIKRMMRVLANHQIVNMDEKERFSHNQYSRILVSTAPNSLQPALAKEFDHKRWEAIGNINLCLTEDVSAFNKLFGMSYYTYLDSNVEAFQVFNKAMMTYSKTEDTQVSINFPFKDFASYCDIGGGTGGLISQVLAHNHVSIGILFDLPEAVNGCTLQNIKKIGGSFFEAVPAAELYTVKRVLHNWNDEDCIKILKNIGKALSNKEKGRILIIERVIPEKMDGNLLSDIDVLGLAIGGQERTLGEFISLGKAADMEFEQQILLSSGISILAFKSQ